MGGNADLLGVNKAVIVWFDIVYSKYSSFLFVFNSCHLVYTDFKLHFKVIFIHSILKMGLKIFDIMFFSSIKKKCWVDLKLTGLIENTKQYLNILFCIFWSDWLNTLLQLFRWFHFTFRTISVWVGALVIIPSCWLCSGVSQGFRYCTAH